MNKQDFAGKKRKTNTPLETINEDDSSLFKVKFKINSTLYRKRAYWNTKTNV
jgi:hypothetical protein